MGIQACLTRIKEARLNASEDIFFVRGDGI
jgi:hypothetical protein